MHGQSPNRWSNPGLVLATFVIGTDDFMIAGVLPNIAVYGLSGAVGAVVGGDLNDRWGADRLR